MSLKTSMRKVFGELFFTVMPRNLPGAKLQRKRVLTHASETSRFVQRHQILAIQPQSQLEEKTRSRLLFRQAKRFRNIRRNFKSKLIHTTQTTTAQSEGKPSNALAKHAVVL